MKTNNITLTLTPKEFEIMRRAMLRYSNQQMDLSQTWGKAVERNDRDAYQIRAELSQCVESKLYKKIKARPELDYISIF